MQRINCSKFLLVIILAVLPNDKTLAQSASLDSLFNIKYSSKELIKDLSFINNTVDPKSNGTSGFKYISKRDWKNAYKRTVGLIEQSDSMLMGEFALHTKLLFSLLHDDHISISYPDIYKKEAVSNDKNIALPLVIVYMADSAEVSCSGLIPPKSILQKINNVPITEIIDSIIPYSSWSKQRYFKKHNFFYIDFVSDHALFYQLFHISDSVQLTYIKPGSKESITETFPLANLRKDAFKNYECFKSFDLDPDLIFSGNSAILKINSFNTQKFDSLINRYNDLFRQIKEKNVNNLIIDVRFNTGGSDLAWMLFLAYVNRGKLIFNCGSPKFDVKEVLQTFGINSKKINDDVHYVGKIYMLTGQLTFSAAVNFTGCMKVNQIADSVFGRETSGQASHYGNGKISLLPNTKMSLFSSANFFQAIDCSDNDSGVLPDVYINYTCPTDYLDGLSKKDYETVLKLIPQ